MSLATNTAAYLDASDGSPLRVASAPYTSPGASEITIKNHALGINPIDARLQMLAFLPQMFHPAVLGEDVAGEVVEVGSNVTRFKVGDRVMGCTTWLHAQNPAYGGFQSYTVLMENMASPIPTSWSYAAAAAVPLGCATAASGLFQKDFLALDYPSLDDNPPTPKAETLLIWGGATSVGTQAIQLAVAAGYRVIATASPRNFDLCRRLGAAHVLDYRAPSVVADLVAAFAGHPCAGALDTANRDDAVRPTADVIAQLPGTKFIAAAGSRVGDLPGGVALKMIFGSACAFNEVGARVFAGYLPAAMARGAFVAEPAAEVVGHGLESVNDALAMRRQGGVSAKKLVVTL